MTSADAPSATQRKRPPSWHERLLVSVVGPVGRLDLRLPAEATVDELVPHLVDALVEPETLHEATTPWHLVTFTGSRLPRQQPLVDCDVQDGDVLYLEGEPATGAPASERSDPAGTPDPSAWNSGTRGVWFTAWAALAVVVCAAVIAVGGRGHRPLDALAIGAGTLLSLAVAAMWRREQRCGPWVVLPPMALVAVGAWQLTVSARSVVFAASFAGGALLVLSVVVAVTAYDLAALMSGVLALTAPAVLIVSIVAAAHSSLVVAAAFATAVWCLALEAAPQIAVFVSRADRVDPETSLYNSASSGTVELESALARARDILAALTGGALVGLIGGWALLCIAGGWSGICLSAAGVGLVALHSRRHRRAVEVGLFCTAALTGAATLLVGVIHELVLPPDLGGDALGAVLVLLVAAAVAGQATSVPHASLGLQLALRRATVILRLSLLPLTLWASGIYAYVTAGSAHLTHRL